MDGVQHKLCPWKELVENPVPTVLYLIFLLNGALSVRYTVAKRREFRMTGMICEWKQPTAGRTGTLCQVVLMKRVSTLQEALKEPTVNLNPSEDVMPDNYPHSSLYYFTFLKYVLFFYSLSKYLKLEEIQSHFHRGRN